MTRSIFQEVDGPAVPASAPQDIDGPRRANRRVISRWLMVVAALVVLMVAVGGLTRLTDSGLSITEWNVVFGALPPLSAETWASEFALYQTTDEFKLQNHAMTLEGFKVIYYWEWGHRLLGRVVGLVYLLPLLVFMIQGRIPPGWTGRLWLGFALVALQGAVGWWMVHSGLSGRVDVAPYRLAAHLGMAFLLFGLLLWWIFRLSRDPAEALQARRRRSGSTLLWANGLVALAFLQILLGALVAGLDAGQHFTDWPLMGGEVFPFSHARAAAGWVNLFEDPGVTQFNHRMTAYALLILTLAFTWRVRRAGPPRLAGRATTAAAAVTSQAVLGIVTLIYAAPLDLALAHQMAALAVLAALLRVAFEAAYPARTDLRGS